MIWQPDRLPGANIARPGSFRSCNFSSFGASLLPSFIIRMFGCGCIVTALAAFAHAQTNNSYPMLMSVKPAAAQIAQTTEHEVHARYSLHSAYQVLVAGEGVKGEVVPPEKKEGEKPDTKPNLPKIKVRFTVAAD